MNAALGKTLDQLNRYMTKMMPMFEEEALANSEIRHICSLKSLKVEKLTDISQIEVQESHLSGSVIGKNPRYYLEGKENFPVELQEARDLYILMPFSPMSRTY